VKNDDTPVRDSRDAQQFYRELTASEPAFVPELIASPQGNAAAMRQIVARFSFLVAQRLNQAPDLDKLAFLDMLGISLIPAHPARAPLVFQPLPLIATGRVPAGTRAGANTPGAPPMVFETESDIALTAGKLTQVVSLWPDRDGFVDHSNDVAGGRPFTLFQSPLPVEHVLYLAHDTLLAFKGLSLVEIRFTLGVNGSQAVTFRWEFWDGQTWRSFRDIDASDPAASQDATAGLTRSGVVSLKAECGDSMSTSVSNIPNHWIRGRLTSPLPPDPTQTFAMVSQIALRTTIARPLTHGPGGCAGAVSIDGAWAGTTTLDLTKTFFPLGKAPGIDSAFYFASTEAFSKPGASVVLCIDRGTTPEEEGDALGAQYATDVALAQQDLITSAKQAAISAIECARNVIDLTAGQVDVSGVTNAISAIQTAMTSIVQPSDIAKLPPMVQTLIDTTSSLSIYPHWDFNGAIGSYPDPAITENTLTKSGSDAVTTMVELLHTLNTLSKITSVGASGAGGAPPPTLPPPRLAWEYYNGTDWLALLGPVNDDATNLMTSGEISFVVPADIAPFTINGSTSLGMRARLVSGSYNHLELVSWTDPTSGQTNFIPVIQPRPPALTAFAIGYVYRSAWLAPEQSLSWNDFVVESHTPTPANPGGNYAPYHPVADTLPALYLGFDKPLPNDYMSIFFNIVESDSDGPPLVWEAWSDGWQPITVADSTGALARKGMVAFVEPGVPVRPQANIVSASGWIVRAASELAAAVFTPGDRIVIQPEKAAEMVTIDSIDGANIRLVTPLAGTYAVTTVVGAALPRFGKPLDWVRVRLKTAAPPMYSQVNGIYANAVWARQVQTINNETLGSGTGQPNQSFFFHQFPVMAGEQVQVRELQGAQANVEYPILKDQLLAQGYPPDAIRTVVDARSGNLTEVWVTWTGQPNFYFSRPGDRHYVLDRASGRILFGDGKNGMLPTPGNSNIVAMVYQAGGGIAGNVAAGAINQLLSGAAAQSVTNPVAAEGGADTETLDVVSRRGPQVLRHRGGALSAADYEALALEASPGVAIARCLPATSPNLRPAPGWVTLILVPHSVDPQPEPSYELKQEVAAYLAARAPDSIESGRINMIPPNYLPMGVSATVAAKQIDRSGVLKAAVLQSLNQFFHPLYGGPDGRGWMFGRDVYLSDVARLVEGISGVDYVQRLELLVDQIPAGDRVSVPPERMVAAGTMLIAMEGAPNA
jgi:predicted phage baseplate assembly protein